MGAGKEDAEPATKGREKTTRTCVFSKTLLYAFNKKKTDI